jgi:hypothetical protein
MSSGPSAWSLSNIELAAKYRFLTQENFGLDVPVFPRVFLPSVSSAVGEQHASFLLPIWLEKDWSQWSAFGGGGCEITRQMTPTLQVGLEVFHQTRDEQQRRLTPASVMI